jgi:hypothetical protein
MGLGYPAGPSSPKFDNGNKSIQFINFATAITMLLCIRRFHAHVPDMLAYAGLLRFQILFLLALLLAPLFLPDLLIVQGTGRLIASALLALTAAWVGMHLVDVVLLRGHDRFPALPEIVIPAWYNRYKIGIYPVFALPTLLGLIIYSDRPIWAAIIVVICTTVAGVLVFEIVKAPTPLRARNAALPIGNRLADSFFRALGAGYVDGNKGPDEHRFPAMLLMSMLVLGYAIGIDAISHGRASNLLPPIGYVEVLLMFVVLALAGAAFFFDRFHLPVVFLVAVWSAFTWSSCDTDHYYTVIPPTTPAHITAEDRPLDVEPAMDNWIAAREHELAGRDKPTLVVICASGGGIQAEAWTAQVLGGLIWQLGPGFAKSIHLISSASGGSVGSLMLIDTWFQHGKDNDGLPPMGAELEAARRAAFTSSLEAVSWGITFPDLWRLFLPGIVPMSVDRGWALEQAWRVALMEPGLSPPIVFKLLPTWEEFLESLGPTIFLLRSPKEDRNLPLSTRLSDWRKAVKAGWLPATMFNATFVDTGMPLVFSTVGSLGPDVFVFGNGAHKFDGADIRVTTSARLSASFSYVSPTATGCFKHQYTDPRCDRSGPLMRLAPTGKPHVVDGGYYDNFGISSAAKWIRAVMDDKRRYRDRLHGVLIIQIRAFPETELQQTTGLGARFRGWFDETFGPGATVLAARGAMQRAADDQELKGLIQQYRSADGHNEINS